MPALCRYFVLIWRFTVVLMCFWQFFKGFFNSVGLVICSWVWILPGFFSCIISSIWNFCFIIVSFGVSAPCLNFRSSSKKNTFKSLFNLSSPQELQLLQVPRVDVWHYDMECTSSRDTDQETRHKTSNIILNYLQWFALDCEYTNHRKHKVYLVTNCAKAHWWI